MLFNIIKVDDLKVLVASNGNNYINIELAPVDKFFMGYYPKVRPLFGPEDRLNELIDAILAEKVTTMELEKRSIKVAKFHYVDEYGGIGNTEFEYYHQWFRTDNGVLAEYTEESAAEYLRKVHARALEEGKIVYAAATRDLDPSSPEVKAEREGTHKDLPF